MRKIAFIITTSLFFILAVVYAILANHKVLSAWSKQVTTKINKIINGSKCVDCNVILISIDTLSSNHLPCYGYDRDTAPYLCRFAEQNILFKRSYSNASWTLPSHISIFTSLYPQNHGVIDYKMMLSEKIPTLTELLKKDGYTTLLYMPRADGTLPLGTYTRGADKVIDEKYGSVEHLDAGLADFKANVMAGKKTFLFLHTYWVHGPYLLGPNEKKKYTQDEFAHIPTREGEIGGHFSPEFYDYLINDIPTTIEKLTNPENDPTFYNRLLSAKDYQEAEQIVRASSLVPIEAYYYDFFYWSKIDAKDKRQVEYIKALYDQKINKVDDWIATSLIPTLNEANLSDNTIVIITSDHGEEFMQHGRLTHKTIYYSNIATPLIMKIPGYQNVVVDDPVQSVDVLPTLLDVLGIDSSSYPFQGISLVDAIRGRKISERLLLANGYTRGNEIKTIHDKKWKLMLVKEDGKFVPYEMFDVEVDRDEKNNVLPSNLGIAHEMTSKLIELEEGWYKNLSEFLNKN